MPTFLGLACTTMTIFMFFWSMYKQFVPDQLPTLLEKYIYKLMEWISTSTHIEFNEYNGEGLKRSEMYNAIRDYLSSKSMGGATRLKGDESRLSIDDDEEVEDVFEGVKVTWSSSVRKIGNGGVERRYYTLSFNRRYREMIVDKYLEHVSREGRKAMGMGLKKREKERKLYTNDSRIWKNVPFNHPATFQTLAMEVGKKEAIKKDLVRFSKGKEYCKKIGKPWKRGYVLFGPPGTGKSTMILAMANFLEYDVYDLELTTVEHNTELKRLMLDTTGKAIIVIEDIDLSQSKVTLSGLLNAIDVLWSGCSDEKIMVFTTNFVDKLDPELIRRARMDNHIEMSYCRFEAFKVLAKNYLEVESHELFGEIERLLEEVDMSPADVAESLMPKSEDEDAETCLKGFVNTLEDERSGNVRRKKWKLK